MEKDASQSAWRDSPDRPHRRGYTTGYQMAHGFVVTQGARSVDCLLALKTFFGVGAVYRNARNDNHREHLFNYQVTRRSDLQSVIIPFFRENRLRTAKRFDFEKFAYCVERMADGHHLNHSGLADLLEVVSTMNRQKPRTELIRILRDHMPDGQKPKIWSQLHGDMQVSAAKGACAQGTE